MLKRRLKKARKSSNFWTDVATITSMVLIATASILADPNIAVGLAWKQGLIVGLFKVANILQHLYKDNEYVDDTTDPTPVG